MNAIAKAEELFRKHYPSRLFVEQLALYLRHGFVINYPKLFVMFRPVEHNGSRSHIINPSFKFQKPDTWYVDLAAGNLNELAKLCPYSLRYFCFARKFRKQLRFYPTDKFIRKCL